MKLARSQTNSWDPKLLGAQCDDCPLGGADRRFVPPSLAGRHGRLIIVGEAPARQEVVEGKPFCGKTGRTLEREAFDRLNLTREHHHLTNALLCVLPKTLGTAETAQAVACCAPRLVAELDAVTAGKPDSVVMTCGVLAGKALGLGSLAPGSIHRRPNYRIIENYHPTFAFLREPWNAQLWLTFYRRAIHRQLSFSWGRLAIHNDEQAVAELERIAAGLSPVGFDVETLGEDPLTSKLTCVGVADLEASVSVSWDAYRTSKVDEPGLEGRGELGRRIRELVISILTNPKRTIITQNGQHDCLAFQARGIPVVNGFDTLLAHATIDPPLKHDLENIALQHFPMDRWKKAFKIHSDLKGSAIFTERHPEELRLYNAKDSKATRLLFEPLRARLTQTHKGWELYSDYMQSASIAAKSRVIGIKVDRDKLLEHSGKLAVSIDKSVVNLRRLARIAGFAEELNPNSAAHLSKLFFHDLNCRPTHRSEKTGKASLDKKALAAIRRNGSHLARECAEALLKYRQYTKLKSTYIDGLPIDKDDRVRASPLVHGARTGRWSYTKPNIHTIPKPRDGVAGLRDLFVASEGRWLIEADFSQLELRIIALVSKDAKLLEWYNSNIDVHTMNCRELFGDVTKEKRHLAKTFVFCVTMDTLALTKNGWKTYDQINVGDMVLSYNSTTEKKEWTPVRAKHLFRQAEVVEMGLSNRGFKIKCTPNHRWFVRQRRKSGSGNSFRRPYFTNEVRTTTELTTESNIIVNAAMTTDKSQAIDILDRQKFDTDWTTLVCQMNSEQRRAFLTGFFLADGWQDPYGSWHWNQLNNEIAEAVMTASFIEHDGYVYISEDINAAGNPYVIGRLSRKGHITGQLLNHTPLPPQDVWCIETDNSSWVIRQGNTITITGNSVNYGPTNLETLSRATWDQIRATFPNISLATVYQLVAKWFRLHPDIVAYRTRKLAQAHELGYSEEPLSGRRRYYYGQVEDTKVYNFDMQTMGAELIKRAMVGMQSELDWDREPMLLQVHDALIHETDDVVRTAKILTKYMTQTITLDDCTMTFPVEIKVGKSWGDMKPMLLGG